MKPSFANRLCQQRIPEVFRATAYGGPYLRHHGISVRDEHRFTRCRQSNVFTELIFQDFQTHCAHTIKVASGSHFCQGWSAIRPDNAGDIGSWVSRAVSKA